MRRPLCLATALTLTCQFAFGTMALNETFDSGSGFTVSSGFFSDGSNDYLGLLPGTFGGGSVPGGVPSYTGFSGGYLVGEDLDGEGATLPITLTWSGIDISGLTDLTFSGDFAADIEAWDNANNPAPDFIEVSATVDGSLSSVLSLRPTVGTGGFNGEFAVDTDGDGVGDGAALGRAATTLTASIPEGSLLTLEVSIEANSGNEQFAFDSFVVSGVTAQIPEPTAAVFGSLLATGLGLTVARRR